MLRNKIVRFKKIYKFYFDHFFIKCTVFVLIVKNVYGKSSAKREYRDKNVFLKVDGALSKLITLLISNKKEFNDFFKSRSSDIVLLKLGNLHQNAKRYEAPNAESAKFTYIGFTNLFIYFEVVNTIFKYVVDIMLSN